MDFNCGNTPSRMFRFTIRIKVMNVVSLNERRKHPRISDAIALRLNADESTALDCTPTHVVKLSCGGLRFVHHAALKPDSRIALALHLTSSNTTVHINCRVVSSGEEKSRINSTCPDKHYFAQVQFLDVEAGVHKLLTDHINYVLHKTGMGHLPAIPA